MRLSSIHFVCCILLTITHIVSAQKFTSVIYISVQGTWDKTRDHTRAQFGNNNKLISRFFAVSNKELGRAAMRNGSQSNKVGELTFRINADGTVDSVVQVIEVKKDIDDEIINTVKSTGGKWVVGKKDDVKQSETVRMWYTIYAGDINGKPLEEYVSLAVQQLSKGEFENAIKSANFALGYDVLNTVAISIMAQALAGLQHTDQACELLTPYLHFNTPKLDSLARAYCAK